MPPRRESEIFKNISELYLGSNFISTLDLSQNKKLKYINVKSNPLSSLDLRKHKNLVELEASDAALKTLKLPVRSKKLK